MQSSRQQGGGKRWPLESELSQNIRTVNHPVPGGMGHNRGEDDRTHAFCDNEPEQNLQNGDEQYENE